MLKKFQQKQKGIFIVTLLGLAFCFGETAQAAKGLQIGGLSSVWNGGENAIYTNFPSGASATSSFLKFQKNSVDILDINSLGNLSLTGNANFSGNIGIGVTNPTYKLDISGSSAPIFRAAVTGYDTIGSFTSDNQYANLQVVSSAATANPSLRLMGGATFLGGMYAVNGGLQFSTKTTSPALTILDGGNVGIGTTNPFSKLQIGNPGGSNTNVHSNEANIFGTYNTRPTLNLFSTDSVATDKGGSIGFGGQNSATSPYLFASIKGAKDGNGGTYGGYLSFNTTASNSAITERMRIDYNGNLGIGTTNPGSVLDVQSATLPIIALGPQTGAISKESTLNIYRTTGAGTRVLGGSIYTTPGNVGAIGLNIDASSQSSYSLILKSNSTGYILLNPTGGNVGIGTTTPGYKLHVSENGNLHEFLESTNSTASQYVTYSLKNISQQWQMGLHGDASQFRIRNTTNSTYPFVINASDGNVGIGTTTPTTATLVVVPPTSGYAIDLNNHSISNVSTPLNPGDVVPRSYVDSIVVATTTQGTQFGPWTVGASNSIYNNNSGKVGIGTTNPESKLHIQGMNSAWPAVSGTVPTGLAARFQPFDSNGVLDIGVNGGSGAWLQVTNRTSLNSVYPLLLNPNGGNVGIGTTNPVSVLQIQNANPYLTIANSDTILSADENAGSLVFYSNDSSANSSGGIGAIRTFATSEYNTSRTPSYMSFYTHSDATGPNGSVLGGSGLLERMRIDSIGNIGIGTTAPNSKLDVIGTYTDVSLSATSSALANFRAAGHVQLAVNAQLASPYTISLQGKHSVSAGGAYPIALNPLGGNVGIATTTPAYLLDINGSPRFRNWAYGLTPGSTDLPALTTVEYVNGMLTSSTVWTKSGDNISNSNIGNVGIGTTTPAYKLDVAGDINLTGGLFVNGTPYVASKWSSNGSNIFYNAGNVGIGTGNPGTALHVQSNDGAVAFFNSRLNGGVYAGYLGNGQTNSAEEFGLYYASNDARLAVYDQANSLLLYGNSLAIDTGSNNVGIGTTNPGTLLDVLTATGDSYIRSLASTSDQSVGLSLGRGALSQWYLYSPANTTDFRISGLNVTDPFTIKNTTGNVGIGTVAPNGKLDIRDTNNAALYLSSSAADATSATSKIYSGYGGSGGWANTYLRFATSPASGTFSDSMTILGSGNVGIGTTNPARKLDVSGDASFTNIYNKGTVLRLLPNEYYGSVGISSALDSTNNTAYINLGTFSEGFTHINIEVELVPWLLNTSNIGSYKKVYTLRMTSASPGIISVYDSRVISDIGSAGDKYQIGVPEADSSNSLRIPIKYIGTGSGNNINAFVKVTGASTSNIDKVSLSVTAPAPVSPGTQEFMSLRNRLGIGTTTPTTATLVVVPPGSDYAIDLNNHSISNVSTPLNPGDVVPRSYVDSIIVATTTQGTQFGPWTVGASNSIYNNNAGNVGIGTTSPSDKLHLNSTSIYSQFRLTGTDTVSGGGFLTAISNNTSVLAGLAMSANRSVSTGSFLDANKAHAEIDVIAGNANSYIQFNTGAVNNVIGTEKMRITKDGKVGIGTTIPANKMQIGPSVYTGNDFVVGNANGSVAINNNSGNSYIYGSQRLDLLVSGAGMSILSGGSIGIGTSTAPEKLTISGGGLSLRASSLTTKYILDTGWNVSAGDFFSIKNSAVATPQILLAASGNVGVGTTDPGSRFDVFTSTNDAYLRSLAASSTQSVGLAIGRGALSQWYLYSPASTTDFRIHSYNVTDPLTIKGVTGNVGIGTTNPDLKLDVNGSANIKKVLRTGNYRHVLSSGFTVNGVNGYLLTTAIPYDGVVNRGMHTVRVQGFSYGTNQTIDFVVNFYLYSSGFSTYGWTNNGSYDPGTVKLSYEGGVVKIWWSNFVYYPSFEVFTTSWIGAVDTNSYYEGWTITDVAAPTTNVVDVPYVNAQPKGLTMLGNIKLNNNWLSGDGGNEGVFVKSDGYVGIGTNSPQSLLDVSGLIKMRNSTITQPEDVINKAYLDSIVAGTSSVPTVGYWTKSGNNIFNNNTGNVGIGTTTPGYKLHVIGTSYFTGDARFASKLYAYDGYISLAYSEMQNGAATYLYSAGNADYFTFNNNVGNYQINTQSSGTAVSINQSGNVGIGTTSPAYKLQISSVGTFGIDTSASTVKLLSTDNNQVTLQGYALNFNTNGANQRMVIDSSGKVGIGTTTPAEKLDVYGNIRYLAGASNGGLYGYNSTGIMLSSFTRQDAIVGAGDLAIGAYRGIGFKSFVSAVPTAYEMYLTNGSLGIATNSPAYSLDVNGSARFKNWAYGLTPGSNMLSALTTVEYVNGLLASSSGSGVFSNDINLSGNNILNVNKLTVATIDPLYQINGTNYSSFAASIVGGVKEEYSGRTKLTSLVKTSSGSWEYEKVFDFNQLEVGSDLWVWRQTVDFSEDNIEVITTPSGAPADIYYIIKNNQLIFRSDRLVSISFRLTGRRFDWRSWPTKAHDQKEKPSFILNLK